MNKFYIYGIACIGFLSSGCAGMEDAPIVPDNEMVSVSLTVSLPGNTASRAYEIGGNVNQLRYFLYREVDNEYSFAYSGVASISTATPASLRLDVYSGQSYKLVLWAQNRTAGTRAYEFEPEAKKLTINYEKYNDSRRDAFFATVEFQGSSQSTSVTLKRPFAEVNILTADIEAAATEGYTCDSTKVTFSAPLTMDMLSGETADVEEFSFYGYPIEDRIMEFENIQYSCLVTNYFLIADDASALPEMKILPAGLTDDRTFTIPDVTLNGNAQTNIYGNFLSNHPGASQDSQGNPTE